VEFQAAANPAASMRQADIAVNDQHVSVQQKPAPCRFEIAPPAQTIGPAGGTIVVSLTTLAGCAWQASTAATWISIAETSGSGSGSITLRVAANAGGSRNASVLIAGQSLTLTQAAAPTQDCVLTLDHLTQAVAAAGGAVTVAVNGAAGCSWTASSNVSWITLATGGTGSGAGTASFNVAANTGDARTGTLAIAGQTFTVTQAAAAPAPAPAPSPPPAPTPTPTPSPTPAPTPTPSPTPAPAPTPAPPCSFTIAPASQSVAAGGGGATVNVSTSAGCTWTAKSNDGWITVMSGANGNGPGTVTLGAASNAGVARSGTVTIAGQTFTFNQAAGCTYSINPTKASIDEDGGAGTPVTVSAGTGCAWTAKSNDSWITITSGATGSGSGTVRYNVAKNDGKKRTGTLTIADHTFTIDQSKK
jgi:hypothetical protein